MPKTLRQLKDEYAQLLEDLNANLRSQLDLTPGLSVPGAAQGAVYVLRQSDTDNYKIGFTTNYAQRKALFDVKLPFLVEETLVHYTEHYRELERALHAYFSDSRLNGSEFFSLTADQVTALPSLVEQLNDQIALDKERTKQDVTSPVTLGPDSDDKDAEMIHEALKATQEHGFTPETVSVSFLQRRLKVGYARAARLKDRMMLEAS